jgi:ethanolamine utilization protein EutP (predicted NTPase)
VADIKHDVDVIIFMKKLNYVLSDIAVTFNHTTVKTGIGIVTCVQQTPVD